jgi:thiol-disulfide isomerase/thioredoxin
MKTTRILVSSFLFMAVKNPVIEIKPVLTGNIADSVLQKMADKLKSLKTVSYDLKRELNYPSEHYHNEMAWTSYFDFQSADTMIGFKYQIEDETAKQVFNGTEKFELDKKEKTIQLNIKPDQKSFSGNSCFYNSIITLKNALPLIIADKSITKTVSDTTIKDKTCYLVNLFFGKRRIRNLGNGFDAMTTKSNLIYRIIMDKKTDLPVEVVQANDADQDFIRTSFTNIDTNSPLPSELSWYYSTYVNEYKPTGQKDLPQLITPDSYAPEWTLPLYNKNENIALHNLKGEVILLDFWIKNCGPCIASVPHLNALQEKFGNRKFEIIGINSYDPKEDVGWFCNKHKPDYRILMRGKEIAEKYGVTGYPTIVLLDKTGKVLYAGGILEKPAMEHMIEKAL